MFRSPRPSFVVVLVLLSVLASAAPSSAVETKVRRHGGTSAYSLGESVRTGIELLSRWLERLLTGNERPATTRSGQKAGNSLDPWGLTEPEPPPTPIIVSSGQ